PRRNSQLWNASCYPVPPRARSCSAKGGPMLGRSLVRRCASRAAEAVRTPRGCGVFALAILVIPLQRDERLHPSWSTPSAHAEVVGPLTSAPASTAEADVLARPGSDAPPAATPP